MTSLLMASLTDVRLTLNASASSRSVMIFSPALNSPRKINSRNWLNTWSKMRLGLTGFSLTGMANSSAAGIHCE